MNKISLVEKELHDKLEPMNKCGDNGFRRVMERVDETDIEAIFEVFVVFVVGFVIGFVVALMCAQWILM